MTATLSPFEAASLPMPARMAWWPIRVSTRKPALHRALLISVGCGVLAWMLAGTAVLQLQGAAYPQWPNVSLQQFDGLSAQLSAPGGRPMVVKAGHAIEDARSVFLDQGESAPTVRPFLDREVLAPALVSVAGGSELARYHRAPSHPTTLFVDATGRLQDMHIGPLSKTSLRFRLEHVVPRSLP